MAAVKRQILIQPYKPDYTESLGDATGQFDDQDIGKAVKYSGDACILCADGNGIIGFISSVEPGTKNGYSVGAVNRDGRVEVLDEDGSLAVGGFVEAGTPGTLGTLAKQNVIAATTPTAPFWMIVAIAVAGTSGAAGSTILIERV